MALVDHDHGVQGIEDLGERGRIGVRDGLAYRIGRGETGEAAVLLVDLAAFLVLGAEGIEA